MSVEQNLVERRVGRRTSRVVGRRGRVGWGVVIAASVIPVTPFAEVPLVATASAQSPGGRGLLAYSFDGDLYTMRPDGTSSRQLASDSNYDVAPKWSSDGSQLVATSFVPGGGAQISLLAADGSGRVLLTSGTEFHRDPELSPDRSQVAYVSDADLVVQPAVAGGVPVVLDQGGQLEDPTFSPDGSTVVYSKDGDLFAVPVGGGTVTQLTATAGVGEAAPDVSPDGSRVAYTRGGRVWTAAIDGSDQTLLTYPTQPTAFAISWSPMGEAVLYAGHTGEGPVVVYQPLSGGPRPVAFGLTNSDVSWQPLAAGDLGAPPVRPDSVPPIVTLFGVSNGMTVEQDSQVGYSWFCADDGLIANTATSCSGTIDGQPVANDDFLPSSVPGPHALVVRGEDVSGLSTLVTVNYNVVPPFPVLRYNIDPGATITFYEPVNTVPAGGLTVLRTEALSGHYAIRQRAQSSAFGAREYAIVEMELFTSGGASFRLGMSPGQMFCWSFGCTPSAGLVATGIDRTTTTIASTGIAPQHIQEIGGGGSSPATGHNWVNAGNFFTNGGYGMYVFGAGLEIYASLRLSDSLGAADLTGPTISVSGIADGETIDRGASRTITYGCADPAGVVSCQGEIDGVPVASGDSLPTGSSGPRTVTVSATDNYGNPTSVTRTYTVAAADATPPTITIASPLDGASFAVGDVATASWTCDDASGVAWCDATVDGVPIGVGDALPTSATGTHTLLVSASDALGNSGSSSVAYTVTAPPGAAAQQVINGGTVSTGSVATPAIPVQTTVTAPSSVSGLLTVTPQPTTTPAPTGFTMFGTEVVLAGPPATAAAPYTASFTVDASVLGGIAPADVQVFRNGVALTGCTSPTAAVPDPCIVSRGFAPDLSGDALVTVRTSQFSTWSLGRLTYQLRGPLSPLEAAPTVNVVKAGASVPVRFRLGDDRGLDVFQQGSPMVTASTACTRGAERENVKGTGNAATSSLAYDARTATYTYTWKTMTAMRGCRWLTLTFKDGSTFRVLFEVR